LDRLRRRPYAARPMVPRRPSRRAVRPLISWPDARGAAPFRPRPSDHPQRRFPRPGGGRGRRRPPVEQPVSGIRRRCRGDTPGVVKILS